MIPADLKPSTNFESVQLYLNRLRQTIHREHQTTRAGDGFFLRGLKEKKTLATALGSRQRCLEIDPVSGKLFFKLLARVRIIESHSVGFQYS